MASNLARVTRQLIDQLEKSFAAGEQSSQLENALCAYVTYFREHDVPAARIVDTACVLIDRASSDRQAADPAASAKIERMAAEITDRCLANCVRAAG